MWYDQLDRTYDCSDSRFLFRSKYLDADTCIKSWPHREKEILQQAQDHAGLINRNDDEFYYQLGRGRNRDATDLRYPAALRPGFADPFVVAANLSRMRVRVIEAWYRQPVRGRFIKSETSRAAAFNDTLYDPKNDMHNFLLDRAHASLYDTVRTRIWQVMMLENVLLSEPVSPYQHNRFPFTPFWVNRRSYDSTPYGVVRHMIDPQRDFNKRRSLALLYFSANQVVMDDDAVEDPDEVREEISRPDSVVTKKAGSDFVIREHVRVGESHLAMSHENLAFMRNVAGVTDPEPRPYLERGVGQGHPVSPEPGQSHDQPYVR